MDNYQCHIVVNNRTDEHLRLLKNDLLYGEFKDGPVKDLPPKAETKAFTATGVAFAPTGTEGTVVYQLGDDANVTVSIYWDIPTNPFSDNTVRVETSNDDIGAQLSGFDGSGSTESCIVKVIDGR